MDGNISPQEWVTADPLDVTGGKIPQRVVSLIPSVTESLFELGFGSRVVGITDYCIHPAEQLKNIKRVGGPKDASVAAITALKPDLVIANREENTRWLVESLQDGGMPVWLTFPQTARAAVAELFALARLFRSGAALRQAQELERALEWAAIAAEDAEHVRYFCPIWQETLETGESWWMTFNDQTYSGDLLRQLGAVNVFAERARRYPLLAELGKLPEEAPGLRDTRYPRVGVKEIIAAQPDVILLPDEPFAYSQDNFAKIAALFADTPAAKNGRILPVDGTLLFWYGTRMAKALQTLPGLINPA